MEHLVYCSHCVYFYQITLTEKKTLFYLPYEIPSSARDFVLDDGSEGKLIANVDTDPNSQI